MPATVTAPQPAARGPHGQVTPKMLRYARRLVHKYDADADGRLAQDEWRRMQGDARAADYDGDGFVTEQELAQRVADYSWHRTIRLAPPSAEDVADAAAASQPGTVATAGGKPGDVADASAAAAGDVKRPPVPDERRRGLKFFLPAGRLPTGLPEWFHTRDADGDGQLTQAEFSTQSLKSDLDQFAQLDQDDDGVLTAAEYLRASKTKANGGSPGSSPAADNQPSAPPPAIDEIPP